MSLVVMSGAILEAQKGQHIQKRQPKDAEPVAIDPAEEARAVGLGMIGADG
jgi:hypothetical protein